MFDINGTLIIFIFSFLIFVKLLNEILIKPVVKALAARAAIIQSDLDAAQSARQQAQKLLDSYSQHVHAVKAQAHAVLNEATEKANYHRQWNLEQIRQESQKKLSESKVAMESERESLLQGLVKQESDLVNAISQKLLGKEVSLSLDPGQVRQALEEAL